MSKPFQDLGLTDSQINSNYTWKQIKTTEGYVDSKVYDDIENNILIVSNQDNTLNVPQGRNNTIIGTSNIVTNSNDTVNVTQHTNISNGKYVIKLGGGETDNPGDSDDLHRCNSVISIGFNNSINPNNDPGLTTGVISIGHDNNVGAEKSNNTIIGNVNNVQGVSNIIIGNNVAYGSFDASSSIVISPTTLNVASQPASNSIIFGGAANFAPTNDARIQFLNTQLLGVAQGAAFPLNYTAAIPIKYKGEKYLIPVLAEPPPP